METQTDCHPTSGRSTRQGDSWPSGDFSSVANGSAASKCRYDPSSHVWWNTPSKAGQRSVRRSWNHSTEGRRAHHTRWLSDVGFTCTNPTKTPKTSVGWTPWWPPWSRQMKALARSYVWWPGMDKAFEQVSKGCTGCQLTQSNPKSAPLHSWEWPARPWQRVHVDFAGPFLGTMFLIVVDAHSKWPEVIPITSTSATRTIEELRKLFTAHSLPEQLVSDNGPQFIADEFRVFMRSNGIKHIKSAPYHQLQMD